MAVSPYFPIFESVMEREDTSEIEAGEVQEERAVTLQMIAPAQYGRLVQILENVLRDVQSLKGSFTHDSARKAEAFFFEFGIILAKYGDSMDTKNLEQCTFVLDSLWSIFQDDVSTRSSIDCEFAVASAAALVHSRYSETRPSQNVYPIAISSTKLDSLRQSLKTLEYLSRAIFDKGLQWPGFHSIEHQNVSKTTSWMVISAILSIFVAVWWSNGFDCTSSPSF